MSPSGIHKAMLLAAGLGTRLRPITHTTPKPMLPVAGKPLIAYSLGLLRQAGIREVMINLHYHGDQIRTYCQDGSQWDMQITYSEEPVILGSGGGLKKCQNYFGHHPFIALNADTVMDISLSDVIQSFHSSHDGLVVLVPVAPQDNYGRVRVDNQGHLVGFGTGTHTFAGIQIITPRLMGLLPEGASSVIDQGYTPLLAQGGIVDTFLHDGYWSDIGSPERYTQACHDLRKYKLECVT